MVLLIGCDKPDALDSSLVEVRVVGEWTHDDWKKASMWANSYYPHTIVEITETGERGRIFGNSIGKTGEVFRVKRWHIREAGSREQNMTPAPATHPARTVDLRTCRPGDKLRSTHGLILTYVRPLLPGAYMDHEVRYPDGTLGTRTHDGFVFRTNRLPEDHDIVEILPRT